MKKTFKKSETNKQTCTEIMCYLRQWTCFVNDCFTTKVIHESGEAFINKQIQKFVIESGINMMFNKMSKQVFIILIDWC